MQIYLATSKRVQYSQSGTLVKVCLFHTTYQRHHSLRAPKVLLLDVYMWKDVMAPEHVPIYLDRVVSQHVSSLKQEWISPKSTYPWSLGQSDTTCAWYLQCTCMTLCIHPFIYSWVPWDGGGVGFTTLTISCLCSKETGHKTTLRICILLPSPGSRTTTFMH